MISRLGTNYYNSNQFFQTNDKLANTGSMVNRSYNQSHDFLSKLNKKNWFENSHKSHNTMNKYDPWKDIYGQGTLNHLKPELKSIPHYIYDDDIEDYYSPFYESYDDDFDPNLMLGSRSEQRQSYKKTEMNQNQFSPNQRHYQKSHRHLIKGKVYDYEAPLNFLGDHKQTAQQTQKFGYLHPPRQLKRKGDNRTGAVSSISNSFAGPMSIGILMFIIIPMVLYGFYFLFVLNAPTPVVRARLGNAEEEIKPFVAEQNNFEDIFDFLLNHLNKQTGQNINKK